MKLGDKFEEHMCPPKSVDFTRANGEKDVFTFQPLGFEWMPKFFALVRKFSGFVNTSKKNVDDMSDEDTSKFLESLDIESVTIMKELMEAMLKESYPDEYKTKEGQKKMSRFMVRNMNDLLSILLEMNSPVTAPSSKEPVTMGSKPNESTSESSSTGSQ